MTPSIKPNHSLIPVSALRCALQPLACLGLFAALSACGPLRTVAKPSDPPPPVSTTPLPFDVSLKRTPPSTTASKAPAKAEPAAEPAAKASATTPATTAASATTASKQESAAPTVALTAALTSPPATPATPTATSAAVEGAFATALQQLKDKQYRDAVQKFSDFIADFPQYSAAYTNRGIARARLKQAEPARADFTEALRLDPRNAVAANWRGTLAREAGDYPAAERDYQLAISLRADDAYAHFNLAVLYDRYLLRTEAAIAEYQRYLALQETADLRVMAWIKALETRDSNVPSNDAHAFDDAPQLAVENTAASDGINPAAATATAARH